jgi:TusA-related sulfurtransferase
VSDLQCPVTLLVVTHAPAGHPGEVVHVAAASGTARETLDDLADLRRGETVVVVTDDVGALVLLLTGRATTASEARVEGDSDGWRLVAEPR